MESEMDMYTLLYLKWIMNKDLRYSRELCSMFFGSLDERGIWVSMGTCVCMAESLHCPPETTTTRLIG